MANLIGERGHDSVAQNLHAHVRGDEVGPLAQQKHHAPQEHVPPRRRRSPLHLHRHRARRRHLRAQNLRVKRREFEMGRLQRRLHRQRVDSDGEEDGLLLQQRQEGGGVGRREGGEVREGGARGQGGYHLREKGDDGV